MLLTIIIVNYNVKYFLEQCLCSIANALQSGNLLQNGSLAEVLVVDNNSADGSIQYLQSRFGFARFICNKENTGYARANNQALQVARGQYVLFLNPDTILPEDIFQKTLGFMQAHPDAGALGVRMIDGGGRFLRESKRGLPGAWASFCKMAGLTALFPSSKMFAPYYLGHLDEYVIQEVEALSGAFLLARTQLLKGIGGFDERFFMYAEDIDLSYRITQAGYKNYYLGDAVILHFKGESTRKDARYVRLFYKAMRQFVHKHYRSAGGRLSGALLDIAIRLRTGLAMLGSKNGRSNKIRIPDSVSLMGDADSIRRLNGWLRENGIRRSEHSNASGRSRDVAPELFCIFCEGREYSFKEVIKAISELAPRQKALVHASASNSIVGSFDKNAMGISIAIY
ncbi:MAG TPA: glycosyltransferase family 2 protein [Chitinophagaceae bacterium]|nr:glycosyltransferase family 2 protein [Chitinophagaceae bacterium]